MRQCLRNLLIKISEDAAHLSQVMSLFVIEEHLLDNSCEILPVPRDIVRREEKFKRMLQKKVSEG